MHVGVHVVPLLMGAPAAGTQVVMAPLVMGKSGVVLVHCRDWAMMPWVWVEEIFELRAVARAFPAGRPDTRVATTVVIC